MDALPGKEFRVAKQQCDKVPNCKIVLGDRRLSVTFRRLTERMTLWEKVKFGWNMISESFNITASEVEETKNEDVLQKLMEEMKRE